MRGGSSSRRGANTERIAAFMEAWNSSDTAEEVAQILSRPRSYVVNRAAYLRVKGYQLKYMTRHTRVTAPHKKNNLPIEEKI